MQRPRADERQAQQQTKREMTSRGIHQVEPRTMIRVAWSPEKLQDGIMGQNPLPWSTLGVTHYVGH